MSGPSASSGPGLTPVSFKRGREHKPRLSAPYVRGAPRHERFWSSAEEAILREWFPEAGGPACAERLPNRSIGSVYQHAALLGLKPPKGGAAKVKLDLPPDIDDRIREGWAADQSKGFTVRLAEQLDVPKWWLCKRAVALGLATRQRKEPEWSRAEERLLERVPLHNPELAARAFREHGFRRSPSAIVNKAKRLAISRRFRGALSATAAARIIGFDPKHLGTMCVAGEIKAGRRGTQRLPQQGGDAWTIEPAELRRFVLANLERIDIRKVEKFAFVRLLVGEELKA